MNVTGATIRHDLRYANDPSLIVHVDETKDVVARLRYRKTSDRHGTSYLAIDAETGLANYLHHNPKNQNGYGGAKFVMKMEDGTEDHIKGPWSSRASVMCEAFDVTIMDVVFKTEEGHQYAGALQVSKAMAVVEQYCPDWVIIPRKPYGDTETVWQVWPENEDEYFAERKRQQDAMREEDLGL